MEKILIAQSKHETANWKSGLFENFNSLFGMKYDDGSPGYRGPVSPEGDNYAAYDRWADSAKHLVKWLSDRNIPVTTSVEDYVKSIRAKGYFTDSESNYLNGLKRFL
jgi:hypothetical protein